MNKKMLARFLYLPIFAILLVLGCEEGSFGDDNEIVVVPTDLSYFEIFGAREFTAIETVTPFINSNGHPVTFEIFSIKKDDVVLDDTYKNAVSITNPEEVEYEHPDTGEILIIFDTTNMGKISIEDDNPFANGDYYFTVKASITIDLVEKSTIFEDVFHLNVGPALVESIGFCPFKYNFVLGGSESETIAPDVFGGNADFYFELGSDTDKLSIDPDTGVISVNSSYTISSKETLTPTINTVSNISGETVSFENTLTIVLSTSSVVLELETNYFFYPTLKPSSANNTGAGGDGYSVEMSEIKDAGWIKKVVYMQTAAANILGFQEVEDIRTAAGVSGITGLTSKYWGPATNSPLQIWAIADKVNLLAYKGCFDVKVVFWVKQGFNAETLTHFNNLTTPMNFEVKISNNYKEDEGVYAADWFQINDLLTCKIGENGSEFQGTPYPLTGDLDSNGNADWLWVKCEMDLADYIDSSSFTIAFNSISNFDSNLPFVLRGETYISDLYFVAQEK